MNKVDRIEKTRKTIMCLGHNSEISNIKMALLEVVELVRDLEDWESNRLRNEY